MKIRLYPPQGNLDGVPKTSKKDDMHNIFFINHGLCTLLLFICNARINVIKLFFMVIKISSTIPSADM